MTESRDLYREATERAHEALAAYREAAEAAPAPQRQSGAPAMSAFQQLTRTLERFKGGARIPRPAAEPRAGESRGQENAPGRDDPDSPPAAP
jgi:hypothetical protein